MKVKEWVDGTLILDGDIDQGVEEAFSEGRYIEAFTLLQAQIDWWMADLHQLSALKSGKVKDGNLGEMIANYPFRFNDSLSFLRNHGVLTDKECGELNQFYELRNRMIHRLIVRSYQPVTEGGAANRNDFTKTEAMKGFEKGRSLAKVLKEKTASYLPFSKQ